MRINLHIYSVMNDEAQIYYCACLEVSLLIFRLCTPQKSSLLSWKQQILFASHVKIFDELKHVTIPFLRVDVNNNCRLL